MKERCKVGKLVKARDEVRKCLPQKLRQYSCSQAASEMKSLRNRHKNRPMGLGTAFRGLQANQKHTLCTPMNNGPATRTIHASSIPATGSLSPRRSHVVSRHFRQIAHLGAQTGLRSIVAYVTRFRVFDSTSARLSEAR